MTETLPFQSTALPFCPSVDCSIASKLSFFWPGLTFLESLATSSEQCAWIWKYMLFTLTCMEMYWMTLPDLKQWQVLSKLDPEPFFFLLSWLWRYLLYIDNMHSTYTIYIYTPALICNRNHQLKPDKITLASDHFENVFIFDIDLTKKV